MQLRWEFAHHQESQRQQLKYGGGYFQFLIFSIFFGFSLSTFRYILFEVKGLNLEGGKKTITVVKNNYLLDVCSSTKVKDLQTQTFVFGSWFLKLMSTTIDLKKLPRAHSTKILPFSNWQVHNRRISDQKNVRLELIVN